MDITQNNKYQDVVALFLCYEPSDVLLSLCEELSSHGLQILMVNDGSNEKYNDIFNRAKKYGEVIGYKDNVGKGYAIRYGIAYLLAAHKEHYKYVITVDADGQHKISDVLRVADELIKHDEIVLGMRKFDHKVPFRSKLGNDMSKFTQTLVTGKYLKDNQCGLRGFVLANCQWLFSISGNRYEYEMDVISYICLHDLKYREVKIEAVYENGNPTSHFKPFSDTCRIQGAILLKGLVSVFAFLIQFILTGVFYPLFQPIVDAIPMEVSLWVATGISFIVGATFNSVIYHPRHKLFLVGKAFLLDITEMIFMTLFLELFVRYLSWNIYLAFFVSFLIAIWPSFLCLKATSWIRRKAK